jgi:pyridoxamine 5'-phosphate oxidase
MNILRNKSLRQLVANFRNEYISHGIDENRLASNPIDQFELWFQEAVKSKVAEPNAMHLATATSDGKPSGRVMLLKGFDESGFTFYSNYESRKGHELEDNPYAAITFLWLELVRQVRIEGTVSRSSDVESETYFQSRPRASQISAYVSEQSRYLNRREELEGRFQQASNSFSGKPIARPVHWGGYCLKPNCIEFWQGRASRLHDRIQYSLQDNGSWTRQRMFP